MRNLLHLSSRIDARQNPGGTSIGRAESETLDLRTSCLDRSITKMSSSPLARSIENTCLVPAASAVVRRYYDARITACSREAAYSNDPRATMAPGDSAGIDVHGASSNSHHLGGMNGKDSGAAKPKPGIVVIHGRAVFRDCFVRCLEISYKDHEIFSFANVAEWCSSKEPSALAAAVVIAVIDSGDEFNIAAAEFLKNTAANVPVVIVSDVDDLDHIVRALKSGVRGYIPTSLPFNIAVEAVRLVKAGGTFVPASSFVHDRNGQQTALKNSVLLTERQMEVVEEIRHGKANKQIAYELNMSEHTVKVHLRHIMRKLKAKNRTEVAMMSGDLFARSSKDQQREVLGVGLDKGFQVI
jgi:DNA-binding NarL/FixJ family response regulator